MEIIPIISRDFLPNTRRLSVLGITYLHSRIFLYFWVGFFKIFSFIKMFITKILFFEEVLILVAQTYESGLNLGYLILLS